MTRSQIHRRQFEIAFSWYNYGDKWAKHLPIDMATKRFMTPFPGGTPCGFVLPLQKIPRGSRGKNSIVLAMVNAEMLLSF